MKKNPELECFFDCSPHAVAALGPGGTVLKVNPSFSDLFGYTPEEAEGANLDDLIAFGTENAEAKSITRRMESGELFDFRAVRRRKGGEPVHVRCLAVRTPPGSGPVVDFAIYEDLDRLGREADTPSEDRACLEALFGGAPCAVCVVESGSVIRQVNREFETLFGYSAEEALGKRLDDLIVPETLKNDAKRLTREADSGASYRIETERMRKDGSLVPVMVYNLKTRIGTGPVRDFVVYLDLTEARQKERLQKEAADRMKRIFKVIPDAVFILDAPEGRVLEMNAEAESFSGYSLEEIRGKTFADLNPWLDPMERARFHRLVQENGSVRDFEARFRRKEGTEVLCLLSAERIELDGEVRIIAIGKDITERARYEEKIRREKAYFENLFHHSPAAVVLADEKSRIRRVNRAFLDLFGLDPEDASPGVAVDDLIAPRDRHQEAVCITQEVLEGGRISAETVRYRKDGTPVDVFLQGLSFEVEGGERAVYGIYQDIRDQKAAERKLREYAENMHRLWIETVNVLASTVEFRDPFTSEHQKNVSRIAAMMAREMGQDAEAGEALALAGLVHDLGKLGIPAELLNKPCRLNPMESRLVQMHAEIGYEILRKIRLPWPLAEIVRQHHERLDGSGYPLGLSGEAILPEARILAVADVFDAMQSHRPYRQAFTLEQTCEELRSGAGRLYDPDAVEACLKIAG